MHEVYSQVQGVCGCVRVVQLCMGGVWQGEGCTARHMGCVGVHRVYSQARGCGCMRGVQLGTGHVHLCIGVYSWT